jgi:hypothetical protein
LRTVGSEHPGGKTAGGFVGKPDEDELAVPILHPLVNTKGLAGERMPCVIKRDLLRNVCIM